MNLPKKSDARQQSPFPKIVLRAVIGIVALIFWSNRTVTSLADEDPLQEILQPVVRPTMIRALENYRENRRYREEKFPLEESEFEAFRADVVGRLTKTLGLADWVVLGVESKQNALPDRFRDTVLKTIEHHGIRMEVHLIEILETGYTIPAVVCLPSGEERRPGVCVFSGHSRHGLRDLTIDLDSYQHGLATRLAQAGFVTIAVEKFDAGYLSKTFPEGDDERELAPHLLHWGEFTRAHQLMGCLAAVEILASHPRVDQTRMGAGGVSLGGWLSMQTAMLNDRIQAVADFGVKTLHVDPDIKPEEFQGEFQNGRNADFCQILPGMLSLCDRNVLSLAYAPRPLLAGHGRKDKTSQRQAPIHVQQLFEQQYSVLGQPKNFRYYVHDGGDSMPHETVIAFFREKLALREPASASGQDVSTLARAARTVGHLQGEMAGEVTATSVILQSRLTSGEVPSGSDVPGAGGEARFELATNSDFHDSFFTKRIPATAKNDFIVKANVTDLSPATRYYYRLHYGPSRGALQVGARCTFQTLAGENVIQPASFVVVTGMNYDFFYSGRDGAGKEAYQSSDKHLGFPALEAILKERPDFFVGTGDNIYYDPGGNKQTRAKTQSELRQKWHEQFLQPRFVNLFAQVPTYWEKDDHDHRYNDSDTAGDKQPSNELGIRTFLEQVPLVATNDSNSKTYRTHRINKLLQIWLVEGRDYRSPNALPDGPDKTLWGKEQLAWLKATLLKSDATFKILISPTPLVGPDTASKRDNHTNLNGFRYEGEAFFQWLRSNGFHNKHFYIACGDRHWQYHSLHPTGFEEFSCGSLVDANAILGYRPGQPRSTDPEGSIVQFYAQGEPSGGFLKVSVWPQSKDDSAVLEFAFMDENGVLQYRNRKQALVHPSNDAR